MTIFTCISSMAFTTAIRALESKKMWDKRETERREKTNYYTNVHLVTVLGVKEMLIQ